MSMQTSNRKALQGKVAFVTGAASGICRETVRLFISEGAQVVAADLQKDRLEKEFADVQGVTTISIDVTDSSAVNDAFDQVEQLFGRLDILVNGAGINAPTKESNQALIDANIKMLESIKKGETPKFEFLENTSDEDFKRTLDVNLTSQFYTLRAASPLMKRTGGGAVINIASVAALVGVAMPLYYPASKAGVLGLTRAAATELAPFNIRVNAIAPGAVNTPLMHEQPEEVVQFLVSMQTIQRMAAPKEIARTILFLANEETGGYYTGQTISPNGGIHM